MDDMAHIYAEQAVLGTILVARDEAPFIVKMLETDDFFWKEHRIIFEGMQHEVSKGCAPNAIVMRRHFEGQKILSEPASMYFAKLIGESTAPSLAIDCVATLKEFTARRQLKMLASIIADDAQHLGAPVRDTSLKSIEYLDEITAKLRGSRKSSSKIGVAAHALIEKLRAGKSEDLITTGFLGLDSMLGGWHRGELAIVAARPSMGKTTFMLSALRQACAKGVCSAFFSLEMRTEAVMQRMFSDIVWNRDTPIHYVRIANFDLKDFEIERLSGYCDRFDDLPLIIDDQPQLSVAEIGVRVRRAKQAFEREGKRLDVVCIDHLGKISSSGRYEGQLVNETGEKTNELAALARETDVAMVVIHQLNRESEYRRENTPVLSDLRDSGNVEQDADVVCFVYRESYTAERTKFNDDEDETKRLEIIEATRNDMDIIVAKNRNGPCGTVELFVDMPSNAVRDRIKERYYQKDNLAKENGVLRRAV